MAFYRVPYTLGAVDEQVSFHDLDGNGHRGTLLRSTCQFASSFQMNLTYEISSSEGDFTISWRGPNINATIERNHDYSSSSVGGPSCPVYDEGFTAWQGSKQVWSQGSGAPGHRFGFQFLSPQAEKIWSFLAELTSFFGFRRSPAEGLFLSSQVVQEQSAVTFLYVLKNTMHTPVFFVTTIVTPEFPYGWGGEIAALGSVSVGFTVPMRSQVFGTSINLVDGVLLKRNLITFEAGQLHASGQFVAYAFQDKESLIEPIPKLIELPTRLIAGEVITLRVDGLKSDSVVYAASPDFPEPTLKLEIADVSVDSISFKLPPYATSSLSLTLVNPSEIGLVLFGLSATTVSPPPIWIPAVMFVIVVVAIIVYLVHQYIRKRSQRSNTRSYGSRV